MKSSKFNPGKPSLAKKKISLILLFLLLSVPFICVLLWCWLPFNIGCLLAFGGPWAVLGRTYMAVGNFYVKIEAFFFNKHFWVIFSTLHWQQSRVRRIQQPLSNSFILFPCKHSLCILCQRVECWGGDNLHDSAVAPSTESATNYLQTTDCYDEAFSI